ncbi:MAG: hypothetical protein Q8Q28_01125, partial [Pseudomonadota bacterium]|nr:hypothetical protein [Pseudomonadota bacterium]
IPAPAGIQIPPSNQALKKPGLMNALDSRLRGNDGNSMGYRQNKFTLGRVVGYDNAHGTHHRHYMGAVMPVEFVSFEDMETRFEADWIVFRRKQR